MFTAASAAGSVESVNVNAIKTAVTTAKHVDRAADART
jgi:hypothetical protein